MTQFPKAAVFAVFAMALYIATAFAQSVSEILERPTDVSITANVLFTDSYDVYFQYGSASNKYDTTTDTTSSQAGFPVVVVFDKLQPDAKYYYRTGYRKPGTGQFVNGQEHSFRTQRAQGTTYRFTVEADSHLYDKKGIPVMMNVTMENQLKDAPDFMIDLGDTFGDDHEPTTITQQDMDQLHFNFLPYAGMLCHSTPFFFCLGNHEGENGYFLLQSPPDNIAVYGTLARKKYYRNPVPDAFYTGNTVAEQFGIGLPENYYSWTWGDAQFIVLDVYRGYTASEKPGTWDWTLGETQYKWFESTLKNSTAKYKFVFAHHVNGQGRGGITEAKLYEWGGYDQKGEWGFTANRPGWDAPIHQLMVQYGVNIFFQGHDHLFAQETMDGVNYQEVPMPADSTYEIGMLANADAYTSNQLNGTGYLRVTVGPDSARVEYVRSWLPKDTSATKKNGEVAFSYSVTHRLTSVEPDRDVPQSMQLEQNYPNPFSTSTSIKYGVPNSGHVLLQVYDVFGRLVATLVDENKQAGACIANFPTAGNTFFGQGGSAGMYYYRLMRNNTTMTRKALFLK